MLFGFCCTAYPEHSEGHSCTVSIISKFMADSNTYDAIVVGSGISGGWAAMELCKKGLKTIVLERGRQVEHIGYSEIKNLMCIGSSLKPNILICILFRLLEKTG